MKLIIHIGTEKTGTSSIQDSLQRNRDILIQNGYFFSQCGGVKNNLMFPLYCMDESRDDPYFRNNKINTLEKRQEFKRNFEQSFKNEISAIPNNIHTVIISSEHFHSLLINQSEVDLMKNLVAKHFSDIKIVCYLREQVETCVSHYSTVIKSGLTPDFKEFISNCSSSNPYYNYLSLLDRWASIFDYKNIIISKYIRQLLVEEDIIKDFYSKINLDYKSMSLVSDFESNKSLNYVGQCLLKELNFIQQKLNVSFKGPVSFITNNYTGKGQNVSANLYHELYEHFRSDNRKVSNKYLNIDSDLFPKKVPENTNTHDFSAKSLREIMPLIGFLLKQQVDDSYADVCRDIALEYEEKSLDVAYKLMKLASIIRPSGGFIKGKIKEYEGLLK